MDINLDYQSASDILQTLFLHSLELKTGWKDALQGFGIVILYMYNHIHISHIVATTYFYKDLLLP